ncbi:MAG: hypothetical protein IPM64_02225 [Phycisphaerales bacterium]|nr:hypothetical protein [Phycisphaerales bacterium]
MLIVPTATTVTTFLLLSALQAAPAPARPTESPTGSAAAARADQPGSSAKPAAAGGSSQAGTSGARATGEGTAPPAASSPPSSAPATQPAGEGGANEVGQAADARLPRQAEIFRALIEEREGTVRPIEPVRPERTGSGAARPAEVDAPMLEGEQIVNRAAKLVRSSGRSELIVTGQDGGASRSYPILESQLLEVIEREADAGVEEFVITAEAKLYRGRNYLLLLKVMRRVPNGNVTP